LLRRSAEDDEDERIRVFKKKLTKDFNNNDSNSNSKEMV